MNGLDHYTRLFGTRNPSIDRASLPTPVRYLSDQGLLTARPRGDWAQIRCPIHKGGAERHPSMSVSLVDGHFRCHACGAKGGGIVKLHMLTTGKRFADALRDLGARCHG